MEVFDEIAFVRVPDLMAEMWLSLKRDEAASLWATLRGTGDLERVQEWVVQEVLGVTPVLCIALNTDQEPLIDDDLLKRIQRDAPGILEFVQRKKAQG